MTAHTAGSDGGTYDPNDDWPDKAKGAPEPVPNVEDMRAHLELLFGGDRCVGMLDGQVEISWTDIYGAVKYAEMFGLHELDEAADYAAERNAKRGVNVFVNAALRTKDAPPGKRAGKEFVLGMTAVPVDWDKPGEGDPASVREKTAFLPANFIVVTGKHPHYRSHGWWVLDEPLMGVAAIEALMKPMAHSLKGDTGVVNADRVMRLAGSVAWPHKPGRIREQTYLVTKFKADGDKPRPPSYNTDRVVRTFQARWTEPGPAEPGTSTDDKNPFTGRFDPAALIARIKAGHWHDGMLKLAAHTVGMGYPDWLLELAFDQFDDKTVPHKERPMDLVRQARVKYNKPNPADPSDEFDFSQSPPKPLEPESAEDIVLKNIRRRPWLFGTWLLKGYLTMLIGTGGQGKSMLAIHVALAVAAGVAWAGQKCRESGGVWIWNNEDDKEELHRRIGGTAKHLGIDLKNLGGRVFANSGVDDGAGNTRKLIVAVPGEHGSVIATPHVADIVKHIKERGIKLLIVDPFVSTHSLNENDNAQMEAVTFLYRQIAHQADCAVMLVHHTSKPGADGDQGGDQHRSRGASSITAAARVVITVAPMSDADAKAIIGEDYPEAVREHCIRVDTGKANLSAPGKNTAILQKVGVSLDNGSDTHVEDDADEIGGLVVPDFSLVQREAKMREQDRDDRLKTMVAEVMQDIPPGQDLKLKVVVTRILTRTTAFGKERVLRDLVEAAILPASAGGVRIGDFLFHRRQDGTQQTAAIYVCKRNVP